MAKLNVVVPAVEVTVIGAAYRKVERAAVAGDIVKIISTSADEVVTIGGFYVVNEVDSAGDAQITDDDGDDFDTVGDTLEVYEKVAGVAVAPKYEYKPGDKVRARFGSYTLKERVPRFDGTRYGKAWDTVEGSGWFGEDQFELVTETPPSDEVVHEGRRYRKVARKANASDRLMLCTTDYFGFFTKGKVYNVTSVDSAGDPYTIDDDGNRGVLCGDDGSNFVVLEPVESSAPQYCEVKRKANVGERIRIVNTWDSRWNNGEEFVVDEDAAGGDVFVKHPRGNRNGRACVGSMEYAVLEPVTTPVSEPQPPRLKVGDYAKVVAVTSFFVMNAVKPDDIVKVVEDDETHLPFKAESLNSSDYGWFRESELVRATDEEVAAYKRALEAKRAAEAAEAEAAKWNAIGRKVGEFKRGDLVSFIRKDGRTGVGTVEDAGEHAIGIRLAEKSHVSSAEYRGVFFNEGDSASLIVPVEQRFDSQL